jgi:two-component system response regulator HydG
MNILIIEDDNTLCELYQKFLTKAGHDLEICSDGWEGFKKAGGSDFNLIISDLNMPNWDGTTSIKSILELSPNTQFIVVTGFPNSETAKEAAKIPQVKKLVCKPLDFEKLTELIETIS